MKPPPFQVIQKITGDFIQFLLLSTTALCLGLLINQFRDKPLPFNYESKQQRMGDAAAHLAAPSALQENSTASSFEKLPEQVSLEEFQSIVKEKKAKVFDARPEIFHRLGHVPGARSLPREDFENYYRKYQSELEQNKNQPLVIYCSGNSCEDSQLVTDTLKKLGYTNIAIFHGGWGEWTDAGLPQEVAQ